MILPLHTIFEARLRSNCFHYIDRTDLNCVNKVRKYSYWLVLAVSLLLGGLFFLYLHYDFEQKEIDARRLKLEYQHNRSIDQFTRSVDKFAGLVSGMRSFMNMSSELPSAIDFQKFVRNQYTDLQLQDSIVVSFIDTSHVFRQSFTRNALDPAKLVGESVSTLRSREEIQRLDNLMKHDSLRMFPLINLVEGWVGLPINFRVQRNGKTVGYAAPILGFKTIVDDIYQDDLNQEFVFHFSAEDGFDFDRERTYNNTQVYNDNEDPEYYKNLDLDPSLFLYSTKSYYGFDITIGTTYKNEFVGNKSFASLLSLWYFTMALLATVVTWQVTRYRRLNSKLIKNNKLLVLNKEEIDNKNLELQKLNDTQHKFFSIIGHDIKQPLNAIRGLLYLLQNEEINDPDLADIIKSLARSTDNTTNLLENLLRWARSQTGDIKYAPVKLDIHTILEEVERTLFGQAKEKIIKIIHHPQGELQYQGDADMLSAIFRNLLSNAIKFSNPGGTIEIETEKGNKSIAISFKDNGVGMTPEKLESLFNLDRQMSSIGTSGEMGTGLGLLLCQNFVERHGGNIEVVSQAAKGTQFTVVLPI